MISQVFCFFKHDIWRIQTQELPPVKAFFLKILKIILMSIRGFYEDNCHLRASALSLLTLLSIVPVLAMAFGIAKGFGYEKLLQEQIIQQIPEQEALLKQIIEFAQNLLETARGGLVAGIGVIVLLYTVVKILSNIEQSFNVIWGIKKSRSMGRKIGDYLSLMLVYPVMMILSSSITVFLTTQVAQLSEKAALLDSVSSFVLSLLKLSPYVLVWALFSFIYIFMPNTKIRFKSGILSGIFAGTLYQLAQLAYITLQVGMQKYNAIYGSFAALPLFIIWLQLSWTIVLIGGEISYSHQNFDVNEVDFDPSDISNLSKKRIALQIMHFIIQEFKKGGKPLTESHILQLLKIPARPLRQILNELLESGILSAIHSEENEDPAYLPAQDPDLLTVGYVLKALETEGKDEMPIPETDALETFDKTLSAFWDMIHQSPLNKKLKEI